MAYNANIPAASDLISQSQSQILANFQALSPVGNGYLDMPVKVSAPTFGAGDTGFYNLNNATTSTNETYLILNRTAPADAPAFVAMSASKLSDTAMASSGNGWSYLPSGLLIKWGVVAAATASVAITPTVTSGGPNFNRVFTVYVTGLDTSANTNFTCGQNTTANNTSGNFTAYCANPSATTSISYLLIGA